LPTNVSRLILNLAPRIVNLAQRILNLAQTFEADCTFVCRANSALQDPLSFRFLLNPELLEV
jgi:hypothetical protein